MVKAGFKTRVINFSFLATYNKQTGVLKTLFDSH